MTGKAFFYGKEVEGRFTGIETVFIRSKIPSDVERFPHIYFTFEAVGGLLKAKWEWVREKLDKGVLISIEVNEKNIKQIPLDVSNRVHLLLRISAPIAATLKNTDTIAIDVAPFSVLLSTVLSFQRTFPQNYSEDTEYSKLKK